MNAGVYEQCHRIALHGLPGAVLIATLAAITADEKRRTAVWAFVACHLHLIGDIAGSRGSNPQDVWPICYLEPVSLALTSNRTGQWPLTSWQNTTLTVALLAYAFVLAVRQGYSPVSLFSQRADRAFVKTLRERCGKARER